MLITSNKNGLKMHYRPKYKMQHPKIPREKKKEIA